MSLQLHIPNSEKCLLPHCFCPPLLFKKPLSSFRTGEPNSCLFDIRYPMLLAYSKGTEYVPASKKKQSTMAEILVKSSSWKNKNNRIHFHSWTVCVHVEYFQQQLPGSELLSLCCNECWACFFGSLKSDNRFLRMEESWIEEEYHDIPMSMVSRTWVGEVLYGKA